MSHRTIVALLLAAILPAHAIAQERTAPRLNQAEQDTLVVRNPLIRVGKWAALAASAGLLVYGISTNDEADDRYSALEHICIDTPTRCERVPGSGALTDADLEREYQDIVSLDDRARLSLAAGQIGVLASVALFILDLPRRATGKDIPYTPPRFRAGPGEDGALRLEYRVR